MYKLIKNFLDYLRLELIDYISLRDNDSLVFLIRERRY